MTRVSLWARLLLAMAVIAAIIALFTGNFIFKSGTAGLGILIVVWLNLRSAALSKDTYWIVTAFLFSIIGDWFLSDKGADTSMFIKGIAMFFIAHLGYLVYALKNGKMRWLFFDMLLGLYLIFFYKVLYPAIEDQGLMIAALAYLIVSCFSAGAAMGMKSSPKVKWWFVTGIFFIIFSDTIISLTEFVGYSTMDFLILPTYYASHLCITYAMIKKFETVPNPEMR